MKTNGFNGWENRQTWAVNLWLDNEEVSQKYWHDRAWEAINEAEGDEEEAIEILAQELENEIANEDNPLAEENNLYLDLLNSALEKVNWEEIAEGMLEDMAEAWKEENKEEEEEEEEEEEDLNSALDPRD